MLTRVKLLIVAAMAIVGLSACTSSDVPIETVAAACEANNYNSAGAYANCVQRLNTILAEMPEEQRSLILSSCYYESTISTGWRKSCIERLAASFALAASPDDVRVAIDECAPRSSDVDELPSCVEILLDTSPA